ncbi:KTSC domain-containing protein [Photobacterium piscicola]|uniref:KTSC domain-containing protein n=1 Tax=Photobacterium piscicola TaxID=1378299 RepID=UPI002E196630|nr:KTSC domain-containing protein [Photobacterium piscicola]
MINWFVVSSDVIKKIGHDASNDCLYIDFGQRGEYEVYTNVSLYAFYHFSLATSIDEYYQQVIRSSYSLQS